VPPPNPNRSSCRNTATSNLLAMDWDVVTVSQLLGHANPQLTLGIYARALPKSRHGAADALAKLLGSRVGTLWWRRNLHKT
jgi:integrase